MAEAKNDLIKTHEDQRKEYKNLIAVVIQDTQKMLSLIKKQMLKGDNMITTLEDLYDFFNGMINIISDRVP